MSVLHACLVHHPFIVFRTPQVQNGESPPVTRFWRETKRLGNTCKTLGGGGVLVRMVQTSNISTFDGIITPSGCIWCSSTISQYPMKRKEGISILNDWKLEPDLSIVLVLSAATTLASVEKRTSSEFLDSFGHAQRQGHWYMRMSQKLGSLNYPKILLGN